MLNNLKGAYLRLGDFSRAVRVIERLRQLDPSDVLQQRDLGVSLMRAGQVGPAIDALAAVPRRPTPTPATPSWSRSCCGRPGAKWRSGIEGVWRR